ncbi:MAG: nitroreductase family protein [Shinella sp.]|nr:nitroreductase family protein [Shinella sp.]
MANAFMDVLEKRRSQYSLGRNLPIPAVEAEALIRKAVRLAPSSYNSQSSRVLVLFGKHSERFWSITTECLREIVPSGSFASTEARMKAFAAGAGTVLFYEDQNAVQELQKKYPLYADNFPAFSEQSGGMAQFAVWSALASVDIGASLQHYNPLIDDQVAATWNIPSNWKLRAQMPFGSNEKMLSPKSFVDDGVRIRVLHAEAD